MLTPDTEETNMEEGLLLPRVKDQVEQRKGSGSNGSLTWFSLLEEVKRLGWIAGPMVLVVLSQYLVQVVSTMMVGHLGELALSSTAIATSLATVTGFSLLVSLLSSLFFWYILASINFELQLLTSNCL